MVSLHLCLCKYWFLVIFSYPYIKIYTCYICKHFEQLHRVWVNTFLSLHVFFLLYLVHYFFLHIFFLPHLVKNLFLLFYSSPYPYCVLVFYIFPLPYLDASGFGDLHLWCDDCLFELFLQVELWTVPPTHVLHVGHSQVWLYVGHV